MADVCFSTLEYLYLSRGWKYSDEVWFADRDWHSEETDIIQYVAGSKIAP